MPDNILTQAAAPATLPSGTRVAARSCTYSGDASSLIAPVGLVTFSGSDDAKSATDVVLPTVLGANGGLKVDIVGDTGVTTTLDTDDGTVAGGQANVPIVISERYTWSGSAWVRGGFTPYVLVSAASTNATSIKASAGVVGMVAVTNTNAAFRYLKIYNKASAPTVGTDTPVQVYAIPPGGGSNVPVPNGGLSFSTGIAFAITTGAAHTDTGAVALSEIIVNFGWL